MAEGQRPPARVLSKRHVGGAGKTNKNTEVAGGVELSMSTPNNNNNNNSSRYFMEKKNFVTNFY